ncbi:hypothetical protein [Ammoniphilus sp. 3BR4]|uniref:hypothetical protein n=1 Tax=Ammoniphilus sp. 3BR4 TaxID=3158265 RepID=UPI003464FE7C
MIYLINFATTRFYKSQELLNRSALRFGIDRVVSYREKDILRTEFYRRNRNILDQKRGYGYWIWKPYIIRDAMSKVKKNDIIIYCDSGIEIINPVDPLIKTCKKQQGIMLFQTHGHLNRTWTKRDCFVLMDCDAPKYWNAEQIMGSFSIYVNNKRNRDFVNEWLHYCCNETIVTDCANQCGLSNFPDFRDHRHDQSILSLLAVKHNIEIYRNPSQNGNGRKKAYRNSRYGTILNHHRKKDKAR